MSSGKKKKTLEARQDLNWLGQKKAFYLLWHIYYLKIDERERKRRK